MNAITNERLDLSSEELAILVELLESERTKLLIEVRHTDHRAFRTQLRKRLTLIENLDARLKSASGLLA